MTYRKFATPVLLLGLVLAPAVASCGDAPTLKDIMQGLRDDYVKIADGLLTDDFDLIADAANSIAMHPRIPAEQVKLVAAELGTEMASFKQLDMRVHELSIEIKDAANAADKDLVLRGFRKMTEGCIGCHDAYKQRVAAVLVDAAAT